jgi:endonuclease III
MSSKDLKELQEMTRIEQAELKRLQDLVERQDEGIAQGLDQVDDLLKQVDFYRKQVNHLLALCNILSKGV